MLSRYVALLRGINVGGKNKIDKTTLSTLFANAGCRDVQTYIQSGNIVFSANSKLASRLPTLVCNQIQAQSGIETKITLRTAEELASVKSRNPYPDTDHTYIAFLAHAPSPERVALLDPNRSPPDEFTVSGREIFLLLRDGVGRSKLTNVYFDSKLQTTSTLRNWRTLETLLAMMST